MYFKNTPKLDDECIQVIKNGKNLLGFSHGVDSTAAFYILLKLGIEFDIAIIDYAKRKQSKEEVSEAKKLANKFKKRIFSTQAILSNSNFEKLARDFRYDFFTQICNEYNYTNLILAHQLNDRFEWMLMMLSRGAGLGEILGMQKISKLGQINVVRPMLNISREQILNFLQENNIKYFIDDSNKNQKFERNIFRAEFSDPFLKKFSKGIVRSFEYLQSDFEIINLKSLEIAPQLFAIKIKEQNHSNQIQRAISQVCKKLGTLISKAQKDELLRTEYNTVLSGKIAVEKGKNELDKFIFISPFITCNKIPKSAKETFRKLGIPSKIRPFLYQQNLNLNKIIQNLKQI